MRISGGYHASVLCCSLGAFLVLYVRGFQRAFAYFGALVISGYAAEIADDARGPGERGHPVHSDFCSLLCVSLPDDMSRATT